MRSRGGRPGSSACLAAGSPPTELEAAVARSVLMCLLGRVRSGTPPSVADADSAMYQAKERGREVFHPAITHARSDKEAATIYGNVRMTAERHLGVRVAFLGSMPFPLPQDVGEILLKRLPMADADAQKRYALQTGSPQ